MNRFFGGKKKNRAFAREEPKKTIVLSLVQRDGERRSICIPNVTAKTLRGSISKAVDRQSSPMTDEHPSYVPVSNQFAERTQTNQKAVHGLARVGTQHEFQHHPIGTVYLNVPGVCSFLQAGTGRSTVRGLCWRD
jgi:hypothetical protein